MTNGDKGSFRVVAISFENVVGQYDKLKKFPFLFKYGPIPASLCLFSSFSHYINFILKKAKCRCCVLGFEPGDAEL